MKTLSLAKSNPSGLASGLCRDRVARRFITVALVLAASIARAAIPATERAALTNLYIYTNGDGWVDNSGWNGPPGTECAWRGVTCDSAGSTIIGIDLLGNALSGSLPSLSALTNLESFNVGNAHGHNFLNFIRGPIPPLNGLVKLRIFVADSNGLTGPIPELNGLTNLATFSVSYNELTGNIPSLIGLSSLTYLSLSNNLLTGNIPNLLGSKALTYANFSNNKLTGDMPALTGLADLATFNASVNQLTGDIPDLSGLTNLTDFFVNLNQLTGELPILVGSPKLHWFWVDSNHLNGGVPDVSSLTELAIIELGGNQLSGAMSAPPQSAGMIAGLCPNQLIGASDPASPADLAWNSATGLSPWSLYCTQTPRMTSVWITSSADSTYVVGQPVTFTAAVYGNNPTGTVTFSSTIPLHPGVTVLCTDVPVVSYLASCTTDVFAAGTSNVINAAYSGDTNNAPSSGSNVDLYLLHPLVETVSANPAQINQAVDLIGTMSGGNYAADTLTFYDGVVPLCSDVSLVAYGSQEIAHCVTTFTTAGPHPLTVNSYREGGTIPVIETVTAPAPFDANQFALTGGWSNAYAPRQGLLLDVFPDHENAGTSLLFGGWFTYDNAGHQQWLTLQGSLTAAHGSAYALGIYETTGGNFAASTPTETVAIGSASMTFYDCAHATLAYTFNDGRSGTLPYTRVDQPTGCSTAVPAVHPVDPPPHYNDVLHSGAWATAAMPGQGLVFDIIPSQTTVFAAWFAYAPQSEALSGVAAQRWFTIQSNDYTPGNLNLSSVPIYATSGGFFDSPVLASLFPVGTADLTFSSCTALRIHYMFTQGEFAGMTGSIDVQQEVPSAGCE